MTEFEKSWGWWLGGLLIGLGVGMLIGMCVA